MVPARRAAGFTLVEVVVVLAVVLLLAAIGVPMINGYLHDGRRARAEAEAKTIASSLVAFYKDLGVWPARRGGVDNVLYTLCTGPAVPAKNPFTNRSAIAEWLLDGNHGDTLDHHLRDNAPGGAAQAAYPTTGMQRWRGPYQDATAPLDPWGRPYLITVRSGTSTSATHWKRLFVISAGPDGAIDTDPDLGSTTDLANDDIGVLVTQRRN
jgi:prepilin-type N-terminal cleavage/methylation domain-containing protein